jgi:hypothetical protein
VDRLVDKGLESSVDATHHSENGEDWHQDKPNEELRVVPASSCRFGILACPFRTAVREERPIHIRIIVVPVTQTQATGLTGCASIIFGHTDLSSH